MRTLARRILIGAATIALVPIALATSLVAVVPPPLPGFAPQPWTPPPATSFEQARVVAVAASAIGPRLHGPEDIAVSPDGALFTGDRDGTIWRVDRDGRATRFADVGGRPLGLAFAPDGRLLIANHGQGLQAVTPDGEVTLLVREAAGQPVLFANDLDVSDEGIVYFSDSSSRYNTTTLGPASASYLLPDAIEGRATGRVTAHDLTRGTARVIAEGLYFPNGVALADDGRRLWIAESNRYRILELDLAASGQPQVLIDALPGTPDNLDRQADGSVVVAYYGRSAPLDDFVLPHGFAREVLARLPVSLFINEDQPRPGGALVIAPDGRVRAHWTGLSPAPTSINVFGDRYVAGALLGHPVRLLNPPRDAR